MGSHGPRVLACFLTCFGFDVQLVFSWAPEGHEHINRIAHGLIKGKRLDDVRSMLHGDVFEFDRWELTSTALYPQTARLHWHHQTPEWKCGSGQIGDSTGHLECNGQAAEENSLFCAILFFFNNFVHNELLRDYPAPVKPVNPPKELSALQGVDRQHLTHAHYLRWVAVLLADIHQPLHWIQSMYDYGQELKILWQGNRYTMLEFWEEHLPKYVGPFNMSSIDRSFQERAMNWGYRQPLELFGDWSKETSKKACLSVYRSMNLHLENVNMDIPNPFPLSQELYERWLSLAHDQIILAGQRLAYVLEDILEHRRHQQAHQEGRGRRHRRSNWRGNMMMNLMLAAVTVPILLFALRWHLQSGGRGFFGLFAKEPMAKL